MTASARPQTGYADRRGRNIGEEPQMEIQIQDLVTSIKKEGLEKAQAEADRLIAEANEKARKILLDAEDKARGMTEKAAAEANALKASALEDAAQARRDAAIAFKDEIKGEFEKLLARDIRAVMDKDTLVRLIAAALGDEDPALYTAEIAKAQEGLAAELAQELKQGLSVRVSKQVKAGFRLTANDGSGYFDCSDEEIMKMLEPYFREIG